MGQTARGFRSLTTVPFQGSRSPSSSGTLWSRRLRETRYMTISAAASVLKFSPLGSGPGKQTFSYALTQLRPLRRRPAESWPDRPLLGRRAPNPAYSDAQPAHRPPTPHPLALPFCLPVSFTASAWQLTTTWLERPVHASPCTPSAQAQTS